MSLQSDDLGNLSDEELERLQQQADGEVEADANADTPGDSTTDTLADPDPEANNAVVDGAAEETPTEQTPDPQPERVAGVASKDGTRVLPYAALQAERRNARQAASRASRAEQELEAARQQIADLKAGKAPEAELTEEEISRLEEDFPEQGKRMRALFNRAKQLEANAPKTTDQVEEVSDDPVQEAIDQVPLLVEWQHNDPEKFGRAQAIDAALMGSPKWRGRPAEERFAYVAKQVADEYDIPYDEPTQASSSSKAKTPSKDPQQVIQTAKRATPNTLSDFKGGAAPDHGKVNFERMSAPAVLDKFMGMTDAEIDAHLARLG